MPDKKWTAVDVVEKLRTRYSSTQQFTFVEQVREHTGYAGGLVVTEVDGEVVGEPVGSGVIDAVVLDTCERGGKGLIRMAFEIKVNRSDFLNELKHPGKSAWVKKECHEFWFVTGPGVVNDKSEIPEDCGWLLVKGNGCHVQVVAPRNSDSVASIEFWNAIARRLSKDVSDGQQAMWSARSRGDFNTRQVQKKYDDLLKFVHDGDRRVQDRRTHLGYNPSRGYNSNYVYQDEWAKRSVLNDKRILI